MKTDTDKQTKRENVLLSIILLLTLVGVGLSIELTHIHYLTHTDPSFVSICAIDEHINCETVARSQHSVLLQVPVSVWGILGNVVMAFFAAWALKRRGTDRFGLGILLALFSFSLAFSARLAYISFTQIDSLCIFCTSLYLLYLILLGLGIWIVALRRANPVTLFISDLRTFFSAKRTSIPVIVIGTITVVALLTGLPRYWVHPGWADIPTMASGYDADAGHWIGAAEPRITIVEFSDYECPHCRKAHKDARLIVAKHPDQLRLIHRHFPLDNKCNRVFKKPFHLRACEFSKAVECAGQQNHDAFWKMNDALFTAQESTPVAGIELLGLAAQIGLNGSQFSACMESEAPMSTIRSHVDDAIKRQLEGTPTFFIDDTAYPGAVPPEVVEQLLK